LYLGDGISNAVVFKGRPIQIEDAIAGAWVAIAGLAYAAWVKDKSPIAQGLRAVVRWGH
jgi:hypothetical protein